MKIDVRLTADELMDVVDAAMDEAMEQELYFDNFGNENVKEILTVIDAALTAMGLNIVPVDEDEDEDADEAEDEEADPIYDMLYDLDDGRTAISYDDACDLMDMIYTVGLERGLSEEQATDAAKKIFIQIGKDYNIDVVEEEEEEEEEEEPEYPDSPVSQCVFIHNGKRALYASDANQIVEAIKKVVDTECDHLPVESRKQICEDMIRTVFTANGVEIIVKDE